MLNNIIIRLVIYYIACFFILSSLFFLFPQILHYVVQESERIFEIPSEEETDVSIIPLGEIEEGIKRLADPAHTIPVVLALILALGVTLPITWVYSWTRSREKYNQSFGHTLLVMPIPIAMVVFLVKGSLALAFSLAGIVAAVSLQASFKGARDTMDTVYMFMAIGIGLASGTQHTTVAYLASLIFVTVSLCVWKINLGSQQPVISGWRIVSPEKSDQASEAGEKQD